MQRFIYKQKGAISIFLVIILLPMMMFASVYIDTSRIKLAHAVAASAGDLTLNTALTNYDNVLKDMYGLFAMSQSEGELIENLEDYYKKSLKSAGLSDEDATTYVGTIMDSLGLVGESGDVSDLLNIEVVDTDGEFFKREDTKSLANPYILKKQIVEFMKYRFAINTGMEFLNSLKGFIGLKEQQEVPEKRKEYFEEQKTVIESCEKAWKNILNYNDLEISEQYLTSLKQDLQTSIESYKPITKNYVMDYYNSVNRPNTNKNYFDEGSMILLIENDFPYDLSVANNRYTNYGTYTPEEPANQRRLDSLKDQLIASQSTYKNLLQSELYNKFVGVGNGVGYYEVQRVIQFNRTCDEDSNSLAEAFKDYYIAYRSFDTAVRSLNSSIEHYEELIVDKGEQIRAIDIRISQAESNGEEAQQTLEQLIEQKEVLESELNNYTEKRDDYVALAENRNEYNNTYKTYQQILDERRDKFNTYVRSYKRATDLMVQTIRKTGVTKPFAGGQSLTKSNVEWVRAGMSDTAIKEIKEELNSYYNRLLDGKEYLEESVEHLKNVEESVQEGGELYNAQKEWEDAASNSKIKGTAISQQNLSEIDAIKEFIKGDEVKTLRVRLETTLNTVNTAISEIEQYTYADEKLIEIDSLNKLVETVEAYDSEFNLIDVPLENTNLIRLCNNVYDEFMEYPDQILTIAWDREPDDWNRSKSPELEKRNLDPCNFYKYLKKNFPDVNQDAAKTVEDEDMEESTDIEDKMDEVKQEAENEEPDDNQTSFNSVENSMEGAESPKNYWTGTLREKVLHINSGALNNNSGELTEENCISSISRLLETVGDFASDLAVDFRDNIYISDYILSMFSHNTFERETRYELDKEANNGDSKNLSEVLTSLQGGSVYRQEGDGGKYAIDPSKVDSEKYLKQSMTLTNIPISPNNNVAYLKEVEYILNGNDGAKKTSAQIMAIRIAFNTIYAFTDSELREGAYSIAVTAFGVPPLTFLVPIAQGAIIIAVAIAESAIDLASLKAGMSVPLFKTKDTWVLKFSSMLKALSNEAIDYVETQATEATENAIDDGIAYLGGLADKTADEVNAWLQESSDNIQGVVNSSQAAINEKIRRYTDAAMDQLIHLCQVANTLTDSNGKINGDDEVTYIKGKLEEWLTEEGGNLSAEQIRNDIGYLATKEAVRHIIESEDGGSNGYIHRVLDQINQAGTSAQENLSGVSENLQRKLTEIRDLINENVVENTEKIQTYINETKDKVYDAVSQGGEELKDALTEVIHGTAEDVRGSIGGTGEGITLKDDSTGIASCFSFHYSDYLRLFLVVGLTFSQESILARTADVIQVNMRKKNGGEMGFQMKNAYTYGEINASVKVKPIMMTLPFMNQVTDEHLSGDGWYSFQYRGMLGY